MTGRWARAAFHRFTLLSGFAAQLAFFLALTLVPLVAVTIMLVGRGLPPDLGREIEEVVAGVLPVEAHLDPGDVFRWARSSAGTGWLTVGSLLALWTSFSFMSSCLSAIRAAVTGEVRMDDRPWRSTASAAGLLFVWVLALLASASLLFIEPPIERGLLELHELADFSVSAFAALRASLIGAILFGTVFLTYWLAPVPRVSGARAALAALWTALGWLAVSASSSYVGPRLWQGVQPYGTLGSVVLFLLWAYVNAWILLIGGLFLVRGSDS